MKILGIDPGQRRIGLALADGDVRLARPLAVIDRRSRREDFGRLAAVVVEHSIGCIVVGQPLDADGAEGPRARTVARWAAALAEALGAPPPQFGSGGCPAAEGGVAIVLWDERLSSAAAADIRRAQGARRKAARRPIDAVAAAVILQDYLDAHTESG